MKKLFFIALFIVYANVVTVSCQIQTKNVEQLVHIMMRETEHNSPYNLLKERTPGDYQAVYDLAIKNPELLQGIIYDGQTFAMLCIKRGYADLLTRLIHENCSIDFNTPCNLYSPDEPQTTVLHELFGQIHSMKRFKDCFPKDYIEDITELTKLIIKNNPDLLDMKIERQKTARNYAWLL